MRQQMRARWFAYYAFGAAALIVLVFVMIGRVKSSPLGARGELLVGGIVCGAVVVGFAVFAALWDRPAARARSALRAGHPHALVENARRDDFRAWIAAEDSGLTYRYIPYFVTVLADRGGLSIWAPGEAGEDSRRLLTLPWSTLGPFELGASGGALPQYVVDAAVSDGSSLQIAVGSQTFGGLFPPSYSTATRIVEALEAERQAALRS